MGLDTYLMVSRRRGGRRSAAIAAQVTRGEPVMSAAEAPLDGAAERFGDDRRPRGGEADGMRVPGRSGARMR